MSKSFYFSENDFGVLKRLENWTIVDIPKELWGNLPKTRREKDLLAVMASGCPNCPKQLNGNKSIIGMDFIAYEENPKTDQGEDSINIYHFTISKLKKPIQGLQYKMDGPYYREALLEHWPCAQEALDFYSSVGLPLPPPISESPDKAESE